MKYLTLLLLLSSVVAAIPQLEVQTDIEIQKVAEDLEQDIYKNTAYKIKRYLEYEIEYKVYYFPRGTALTWYQKSGDCTDNADITIKMMNHLNISTRRMNGIVKSWCGNWSIHDWYEYQDENGEWINPEKLYWQRIIVYWQQIEDNQGWYE